MLKFSMLLQAIDRVTGPAKRIQASVKGMTRGITELSGKTRAAAAPASRLDALNRRLVGSFAAAGRAARFAAKAGVAAFGFAAEKAGFGVGRLIRKMGGLALGAAKWAGAGAGAAGGFALFDLFRDASKMEQFTSELSDIAGSAQKAGTEMAWLKRQVIAVPILELADAYVQLRRAGIEPTADSLRAIADQAVQLKKPIVDIVDALKEAKAGDFGGLESLKIKSAVKGQMVTFTWLDRAGKRASKSVRNSAGEIERAMLGIFDSQSAGAANRFGRTFGGMIAGLRDQWSRFQLMVADAGIFDLVKGKVSGILAKVNEWAKNGKLKAWAEKISVWLERAFTWATNFIENTNWAKVGDSIANVAKLAMAVADGLSNAYKWATLLGAVDAWADRGFNPPAPGAAATRPNRDRAMTGGSAVSARPGAFGPKWPNGPATPPRQFIKKTAANDTRVGGAVRIILEAKDGTAARVASISSDNRNVPVSVQVGRTMAGAA